MSAAIDHGHAEQAAPILRRIRGLGGDAAMRDGRIVLQNVSKLGSALLAELKLRRDDLVAELVSEADDDAAFIAAERAAIEAEGEYGNPAAPVAHEMPPSWSDVNVAPTAGASCRCCRGRAWWTEATSPKGWRCSTCHPGDHLPSALRREVLT